MRGCARCVVLLPPPTSYSLPSPRLLTLTPNPEPNPGPNPDPDPNRNPDPNPILTLALTLTLTLTRRHRRRRAARAALLGRTRSGPMSKTATEATSADSPSSPRQRQINLRAISSLGQPQPASANRQTCPGWPAIPALSGWPYRPCFPHRPRPQGGSTRQPCRHLGYSAEQPRVQRHRSPPHARATADRLHHRGLHAGAC